MITDIALLINPAARRGRAGRVARDFAASVRHAGVTVRELVGGGSVQSAELAATAVREGCGALVACGGDGTVHGALQAVAGTSVPLGVAAAGAGNDFARAVGLEFDLTQAGMGKRSKRYSMIIDNGVIKSLNVEDKPGVNVSGADTILGQL